MVARCERQPGQLLVLIGDKNFRGKEFETELQALDATILRPRRKDEKTTTSTPPSTTPALRPASQIAPQPDHDRAQPGEPHLAPIRQRIESIFWTCKDLLTLERHGARTIQGLRERVLQRFLCLAACIVLNHQLGRPSRALVDYIA